MRAAGDIDDVLNTIDEFAVEKSMLVNVGDEKGQLLDAAVRRANPDVALELGTYCGYSAGDGGQTLGALAGRHGFGTGTVDLLFIDHEKSVYLSDLQSILDQGWLHTGSIVVADNVRVPGAPKSSRLHA